MKHSNNGHELLGTFSVVSGKLRISDPCYSKDTWCTKVIDVKKGDWTASVYYTGEGRVGVLKITHPERSRHSEWEEIDADIGVDSGQCGFFDEKHYKDDGVVIGDTKVHYNDGKWYDMCCDRTYDKDNLDVRAGIIPFGVVSSSGYGDGSYCAYVCKNNDGEVIGVQVVFIDEEEDEDLEKDEDEE